MLPDDGVKVELSENASRRTKVGLFQPFGEQAHAELESALGEGVSIFGFARLIVVDKESERLVPTANSEPVAAYGCGADHHIHVYLGVHDETTGTSHLTHDITLAGTTC